MSDLANCPRCGRECQVINHNSAHCPTCMMGFRTDRPDAFLSGTWLVCAPGDPTERQLRAIRELSGGDSYCMTRYNDRSHWIRVEVERANGATDIYTVAPNGRDSHFIETLERTRTDGR